MSNKLKVFISGQKYFGQLVLRECLNNPSIEVVGVCTPFTDKHVGTLARLYDIPIVWSGSLNWETMPDNVDLGITAHSFDYIGKQTRYKTKYGWIGYHPSLLPRHRGKSSIEWAIRMRDPLTGGSVFWLDAGIDRGDIAYQDFVFIDPKLFQFPPRKAARILWEHELCDMGLRLFKQALNDISKGIIKRKPQNPAFGTFEPSTEVSDVYKPDALMLNSGEQ